WTKDAKGFFYCRYDEPSKESEFQSLNFNQKIYYHVVGEAQSEDVLVYEAPEHPSWGFSPTVSRDGNYLIVTVWKGTANRYRVFYRDLRKAHGTLNPLIDKFENQYNFLGNEGSQLFFQTDLDAPLGRIISIDIGDKNQIRQIVPESKATLEGVRSVGNLFILQYLSNASSKIAIHRKDGRHLRDIELPGIGQADGFTGDDKSTDTYFSFSSFTTPPSVYKYDLLTSELRLVRRADVNFDPTKFEVTQVFATSKDGTKVPMFLAHKKGLTLDGSNPTLLYGYGGFNISLTPSFAVSRLAWMDLGGIFVMANLRGGGEFGESWHEAGTKLKKQNVFDDFIACAEWLIESKYTSSKKLAIQGGSNGGLLVGACMCQRPELFAACLPAVGVMDMLRFHKFTAGRFWVDDYGCADDADEFKALLAYSPYHNLKKGTAYPATLVTTADTDDRVVPGHSFKFAAALQEAHNGPAPVMIRIESKAGHGAGKPVSKMIEEVADLWAFLAKALKMDLPSN
ncbi:MAG: prolyl oligopeptidase, partial [Planctomycetota bacterium]